MHAPNLRYFAFVSKFVDAVTTSALDDAFERAIIVRRMAARAKQEPVAMVEPVLPRAA